MNGKLVINEIYAIDNEIKYGNSLFESSALNLLNLMATLVVIVLVTRNLFTFTLLDQST